MCKNRIFTLCVLSVGLIVLSVMSIGTGEATIYVDDDNAGDPSMNGSAAHPYDTIQRGIDNATDGDVVHVTGGTYEENVLVNKRLSLIGAGMTNTTIDGGGSTRVVDVASDWVNITGFRVMESAGNGYGVYLSGQQNCSIRDNNISNCHWGIRGLMGSHNLTISGNHLENWRFAVEVLMSNDCRISNNTVVKGTSISFTHEHGIMMSYCYRTNVSWNHVENCSFQGIWPYRSNGTFANNTVWSCGQNGFVVHESSECLLENNTVIRSGSGGIRLQDSSWCVVYGNELMSNSEGVSLTGSSDNNTFYHNEFLNSGDHVTDTSSGNHRWNSTYPLGGNYWDNYTAPDWFSGVDQDIVGPDGFGDTPIYDDKHPLMRRSPAVVNMDTGERFLLIQGAIDDPDTTNGHRIFVNEGRSYEHIIVNKTLSLIGNGSDSCAIDGNGSGTVITIESPWCNVSGFKISNGSDLSSNAGVHLTSTADNCSIEHSLISDVGVGIRAQSLNDHVITRNTIDSCDHHGIHVIGSSDLTVLNNTITSNGEYGIYVLTDGAGSVFHYNVLSGNSGGLQNDDTHILDAGRNYWGHGSGPSGQGPGSGQSVSTNVDYEPWYCTETTTPEREFVTVSYNPLRAISDEIQPAIDAAQSADNVSVSAGTYDEAITISKTINLVGAGWETTTIESNTVEITADWVNLTGFKIIGSSSYAIRINGGENCTIWDNNITDNHEGLWVVFDANNNTIRDNLFSETRIGVFVALSRSCIVSNNRLVAHRYGIYFEGSVEHSVIEWNDIRDCNQDLIVVRATCSNITVANNTGTKSSLYGIRVETTVDSLFENNTIHGCTQHALYLYTNADRNVIVRNAFGKSNWGITSHSTTNDNLIYWNSIYRNNFPASDGGSNRWNESYPTGGNFWETYTGDDHFKGPGQNLSGSDGIGDTVFSYGGATDSYPLMFLFPRVKNIDTGDEFLFIQDAIDDNDTVAGHTLVVSEGRSTENVTVNKSLTIQGNQFLETEIDGNGTGTVFQVKSNWVKISHLNITNGGSSAGRDGIEIVNASHITIDHCEVDLCYDGISASNSEDTRIANCFIWGNFYRAVSVSSSPNITIRDSYLYDNGWNGIDVIDTDDAKITGNNISEDRYGIYLQGSDTATVTNNTLFANSHGVLLSANANCTIDNNTFLNNNYGVYFMASTWNHLVSNSNLTTSGEAGIILGNCHNITIHDNRISGGNYGIIGDTTRDNQISGNSIDQAGDYGIFFDSACTRNTIDDNYIWNNNYGISLEGGPFNNTVVGNRIDENIVGIYLWDSEDNKILNNEIEDSTSYGVDIRSGSDKTTVKWNNFTSIDGYALWVVSAWDILVDGNNLTDSNWEAITLTSCNNATITGNTLTSSLDHAIHLNGAWKCTIANNTIDRCDGSGIQLLSGSEMCTVEDNYLYKASTGIEVGSDSNDVVGNTLVECAIGVSISWSDNVTVKNNSLDLSEDWGIYASHSVLAVNNNTITNSTLQGLILDACHHCTVEDNEVSGNSHGVHVKWTFTLRDIELQNNIIHNNSLSGIYLESANETFVRGNTLMSNGESGMTIHRSHDVNASGNTFGFNPIGLLVTESESIDVQGGEVLNNTNGIVFHMSRNSTVTLITIRNNTEDGISLNTSCDWNAILDSTISGNGDNGIYLFACNNNTISSNTVEENNYGIQLNFSCRYNAITGNHVLKNMDGIYLTGSGNNDISWNNITGNHQGFYLPPSGITNLSWNNIGDDIAPQINDNGWVVWQGYDGSDLEIFLWDGSSVTQLTGNDLVDANPLINNQNHVVWRQYEYETQYLKSDIMFWDGSSVTTISNDENYNGNVVLNDNDDVLWLSENRSAYYYYWYWYSNFNILRLWNGSSTTDIVNTTAWISSLDMNDTGHVVFQSNLFGTGDEIYYWDGSITSEITNNTRSDMNPQINNRGEIAWRQHDGSDWEIFLWDGSLQYQLTNNNWHDDEPQLNNKGDIAWWAADGSGYDIFHWDGNSVGRITNSNFYDINPQINDNGEVVWQRSRHYNSWNVFYWNGIQSKALTKHGYWPEAYLIDRNPKINNNGGVVWESWHGQGSDIILAEGHNTMDNNITQNTFYQNDIGAYVGSGSVNSIYHNSFIDNDEHAWGEDASWWNASYPTGGNYWDDYNGVDFLSGKEQLYPGSDGFGDTKYRVGGPGGAFDRYPLARPIGAPNGSIAITSHSNGEYVSNTIVLEATATFPDLGAIRFYVDGKRVGTDGSYPYQHILDTTTLAEDTPIAIRAEAMLRYGFPIPTTIMLFVNNDVQTGTYLNVSTLGSEYETGDDVSVLTILNGTPYFDTLDMTIKMDDGMGRSFYDYQTDLPPATEYWTPVRIPTDASPGTYTATVLVIGKSGDEILWNSSDWTTFNVSKRSKSQDTLDIESQLAFLNQTLLDLRSYVEGMNESLHIRLDEVLGNLTSVLGKLDVVNATLNDIQVSIDGMNTSFAGMISDMSDDIFDVNRSLSKRIASMEGNLSTMLMVVNSSLASSVQNLLSTISTDIAGMNSSLSSQMTSLNMSANNSALKLWLSSVLDGLAANLSFANDTLHQSIADLDTAMQAFETNMEGRLSTLIGDLTATESNLTALIDSMNTTTQGSLHQLLSDLATHDSEIKTELTTLSSAIGALDFQSLQNISDILNSMNTSFIEFGNDLQKVLDNMAMLETNLSLQLDGIGSAQDLLSGTVEDQHNLTRMDISNDLAQAYMVLQEISDNLTVHDSAIRSVMDSIYETVLNQNNLTRDQLIENVTAILGQISVVESDLASHDTQVKADIANATAILDSIQTEDIPDILADIDSFRSEVRTRLDEINASLADISMVETLLQQVEDLDAAMEEMSGDIAGVSGDDDEEGGADVNTGLLIVVIVLLIVILFNQMTGRKVGGRAPVGKPEEESSEEAEPEFEKEKDVDDLAEAEDEDVPEE